MNGIITQNRNRAHAVQNLKKYLKTDDHYDSERYLNASFANSIIYIGDSLEKIAKLLEVKEDIVVIDNVDDDTED